MKKLILLLVTILVFSCAARKTETEKKQEATKTDLVMNSDKSENSVLENKEESKLTNNTNVKIDKTENSESDELTVEPIDNAKPSVYTDPKGNKHILNNAKLTNKKNKQETKTISDKSDNSEEFRKAELNYQNEQKQKLAAKIKAEQELSEKNKKTDREQFSSLNFILLLIPLALIFIAWRVYKIINEV